MNSEVIQAYPLQWPAGWKRTHAGFRARAKFNKERRKYSLDGQSSYKVKETLTVSDATIRVLRELETMGVHRDDIVISTNVELRLDGLPRSGQRAPADPGAAVYWRIDRQARCMAVDQYDRVEDNLAAIAATLDAMRAIERHGGALILDRVFQGFAALPSPDSWWQVLELPGPNATRDDISRAHRDLAMKHHPDRGGDGDKMARINRARDQGMQAQ